MDLGAFAQIHELKHIMDENGIEVERLRGLRLMKDEKPFTEDVVARALAECEARACEQMAREKDGWVEWSWETDLKVKKYIYTEDGNRKVRWNKLHGKKRKRVKYLLKRYRKTTEANYKAWNRHCGRPDVLYIHARIGGSNWRFYGVPQIEQQPWFIERADDIFDSSYCDIYAKIKEG